MTNSPTCFLIDPFHCSFSISIHNLSSRYILHYIFRQVFLLFTYKVRKCSHVSYCISAQGSLDIALVHWSQRLISSSAWLSPAAIRVDARLASLVRASSLVSDSQYIILKKYFEVGRSLSHLEALWILEVVREP